MMMRQTFSSTHWVWSILAFLTLTRLFLAGQLSLTPDEAYYWIWSKHLQASYLDHPPVVAYLIRAGTWIWGDTPFGVRFLGPVLTLAGSFFLIQAGKDLCGRQSDGLKAALLLNATLFLGVGAATMTPDTPLLFFYALALWALGRLFVTRRPAWWIGIGAAFGLGFDSKYTAVLPAMACFLWWIFLPRKMSLKWPLSGVLTGMVMILPVLLWNAGHHWASFLKQGGRAQDWEPWRAVQFCGELLGGQMGLATPLVFILCIWGVIIAVRRARRGDALWLLSAMVVLPACVFLQHAMGGRVQANWPVILYPAATLLAARLRGVAVAASFGFVMTGLIYFQALTQIVPLAPHQDIMARQTGGWRDFAQGLARQNHGRPVIFRGYAQAAIIHFYAPDLTVLSFDPRWSFLDRPQAREREGTLVDRRDARDDLPHGWIEAASGRSAFCRMIKGRMIRCYRMTPIEMAERDAAVIRQVD